MNRPTCKCIWPECTCETKLNIDAADYTAMKRRAEQAEAELMAYREIPLMFIADALDDLAHAQETGALDPAGHYRPAELREAALKLSGVGHE